MAKEDLAIAESADVKREAYKRAAAHIVAHQEATGDTNPVIAKQLGITREKVNRLVRWHKSGYEGESPYTVEAGYRSRANRSGAKQLAAEEPEALVEAIAAAPLETREQIADLMAEDEATALPVAKAVVKMQEKVDKAAKPTKPTGGVSVWGRIIGRCNAAFTGASESLRDLDDGESLSDELAADVERAAKRAANALSLLAEAVATDDDLHDEIAEFLAKEESA